MNVKTKKGVTVVDKDEEFTRIDFDKLKGLKAVFQKGVVLCFPISRWYGDGRKRLYPQ